MQMAGAVGIEPTQTVLETAILPLNHAPKTLTLYNNIILISIIYQ